MTEKGILISNNLRQSVEMAMEQCAHDRLFVLCDSTTARLCWPLVQPLSGMASAQLITIPPTDEAKTLDTLAAVWTALQQGGATRHSLMVNLGGGMVTDLGGFAASTFKRGLHYINIPTTLLSQVDASVGGKTGINFGGLKNEIGVFSQPDGVIIDTTFLQTLDRENLLSGYAEMLKHGLISDTEHWTEVLGIDFHFEVGSSRKFSEVLGSSQFADSIAHSIAVKERIVTEDPTERGLRKALNLGHTVGHAIESLALAEGCPVLHGYAVAWGLVAELYLSVVKAGFPQDKLRQTTRFIREHYGLAPITCKHYDRLFALMQHDKKNVANEINFTLLADIGDLRLNQTATREEILEALDFLQDG